MAKNIFIEGIDRLLLDFAERRVAESEVSEKAWDQGGGSVTAIILAAAAVEAYVGEWLAEHGEAAGISKLTRDEWVDGQAPVVEIIKQIFKEVDGPNLGALSWFNGLWALATLRNHLVHYYPVHREPGTWPEKLEPYITNHTLDPAGGEGMDWTSRVLVSSVARQALELARAAIDGFNDVVGVSGKGRG